MDNPMNSKGYEIVSEALADRSTDALAVPFSFTHGVSSWPPVAGKEFVAENGGIRKIVNGSVSAGTVRHVTVGGLRGYDDYIEKFSESDFAILGTSPVLADRLERALSTVKLARAGEITRTRQNFPYGEEALLAYFDLDRPADALWPSIEEIRQKLIQINSAFANVGFLVRGSASCGVYLEGDPEPIEPTGGLRLYFVFETGLDAEKFARDFLLRAFLAGFGSVKVTKGGAKIPVVRLDKCTELDLSVFQPERVDFCGANPVRNGVLRKKFESVFIEGGWYSPAPALKPAEEARAEMLKQAALDAAEPEASRIRVARRVELGKAAAKATNGAAKSKIEKYVVGMLERNDAAESESKRGFPILYATMGQTLNFEKIGTVDVLDVLRAPETFADSLCDDPLEPEKGLKGIFYAGKHRQVFSFASHGYLIRFMKVEIIFDHEHPLDTMKEVDAVLCSGKLPDLFVRGGEIVKISRDGQIKPVSKENLPIEVCRLVKFLEWRRPRNGGWELVPMSPSLSWWQAYANRVDSGLPSLVGVRAAPFLDGRRLVCRRGFDAGTGQFLIADFKIDDARLRSTTRETATAALQKFLYPFRHFPFVRELDKIAFVACCLAAVQRPKLGNVPAFMMAARCAGTGKTLLAETVSILATDRRIDPISFKSDEAEMAKTWLAVLREGSPLVLLDNINSRFGGDDLCTILTSEYYRGRILGASKTACLPTNNTLIVGTGNNPAYLPDMPRRVIEINLDARCERPQDRVFDEDLLKLVSEQRVELLTCLFEILTAYDNVGRSSVTVKAIGSFESFVDQISRPLMWLTGVDVAEAMPSAVTDDDTALLAELLQQWRDCVGHGKATLADALSNPFFRAWAAEYFADARATVNKQKLGKFLQKQAGRIIDGWALVARGTSGGVRIWQLEAI